MILRFYITVNKLIHFIHDLLHRSSTKSLTKRFTVEILQTLIHLIIQNKCIFHCFPYFSLNSTGISFLKSCDKVHFLLIPKTRKFLVNNTWSTHGRFTHHPVFRHQLLPPGFPLYLYSYLYSSQNGLHRDTLFHTYSYRYVVQ